MSESIVPLAEENQRCYMIESSPKFRSPGGISQASEQILVELREIIRKNNRKHFICQKKKKKKDKKGDTLHVSKKTDGKLNKKANQTHLSFSIDKIYRLRSLHTFDSNLDSRRIDAQEIPSLAFIRASIAKLNTGKSDLPFLFVKMSTVHPFVILIPSDIWLGKTHRFAGKGHSASVVRCEAGWWFPCYLGYI